MQMVQSKAKGTRNGRLTPMVRNLLQARPERVAELLDCCWRNGAWADGCLALRSRELLRRMRVIIAGAWARRAAAACISAISAGQGLDRRAECSDSSLALLAPVANRDRLQEAPASLKSKLDAPPENLKRARRQLSRFYHPDKLIAVAPWLNPGAQGEPYPPYSGSLRAYQAHRGFRLIGLSVAGLWVRSTLATSRQPV